MHSTNGEGREAQELCIAGNFVEVYLAREGHTNPVGINYLEKIQPPHLPSLYGAMLAGVGVVIMGAGVPLDIPDALNALADHKPASYPMYVRGAAAAFNMTFDPVEFIEGPPPTLQRPAFLPIVASSVLATMLVRRLGDGIAGFVIEGPTAGGHNAPPRGAAKFTADGQPVYGPRDVVDLEAMRKLGKPFWLAGGYGSRERLQEAIRQGAAGVQVGTAFALCAESGLLPEIRRTLVEKALQGKARVRTDPVASPAGFPFKIAELEGTLSQQEVHNKRQRVCDLGFLREAYQREDGTIGFRCPAESETAFTAKGGDAKETAGRICLCNALVANVGMPQRLKDGSYEPCLITLGDDVVGVKQFCRPGNPDYTAEDVIRSLLGA
jgi:nitronate monooxygenase